MPFSDSPGSRGYFCNAKLCTIKKQFSYGGTDRLKSRKRIEALFKTGNYFVIPPFRVCYQFTEMAPSALQAGFTASSRHFKKAVDRNRIKRLLREAYRMHQLELKARLEERKLQVSVFFIYTGKELPVLPEVQKKITLIIERLITIVENHPVHM